MSRAFWELEVPTYILECFCNQVAVPEAKRFLETVSEVKRLNNYSGCIYIYILCNGHSPTDTRKKIRSGVTAM
jgi:hypothetical protein